MSRAADVHPIVRLIKGGGRNPEPISRVLRPVNWGWITVLASLLLSMLGVYAIDIGLNQNLDPSYTELSTTAIKQLIFMIMGIVACLVIMLPHYKLVSAFAWFYFAVCLGLLIFLLVPGIPPSIVTPRNGARSWINLGITDFQPSEITKIAIVLAVAQYLRFRTQHRKLRGLVVPGIIAAVPVGLITVQPDLGTASLFVPALFAM
ncbi:MAG: FtsW/RodA/SpoVE family cell cycle protein, partial [bacterium]|nr:FtsW/RodA/SpoVE family cell cycle protein [bacterium]